MYAVVVCAAYIAVNSHVLQLMLHLAMPLSGKVLSVAIATGAAASSSDADQALQLLSKQVAGKTPPTNISRQICVSKQLNIVDVCDA